MKKILILLTLLTWAFASSGQSVQSSCIAADSILARYQDDADRLTLRKIYRQGLTYIDSVTIPQSHADTVLNALIAVYNATTLPARDSVVSIFDIHTFPEPILNGFNIAADSTLQWMQQLKLGNIPTGYAAIDNVIATYDLSVQSYLTFGNSYPWHDVVFTSDNNYNFQPLTADLTTIPGVYASEPNSSIGDGNNISDSVYIDHVELIYSHGWGDCPSGCTARRFWKFNVYFDCTVTFVGSYGTPLQITSVAESSFPEISVFPNPFSQNIQVRGFPKTFEYTISNILGQPIIKGTSLSGTIENLNELNDNFYFLTVHNDQHTRSFKLYHE
jgi:hypothetical protein